MKRTIVGQALQVLAWAGAALAVACSDGAATNLEKAAREGDPGAAELLDEPVALGQAQEALFGFHMPSSCSDPTGTDSVLAAIAVSSARELRRWNPVADFYVSGGTLKLTAAGKSRCSDGECFNTQALLELQNDAAVGMFVRPGVPNDPPALRQRLTRNHAKQTLCTYSLFKNCGSPDHQFTFLHSEAGGCDTNYTFQVRKPNGSLLSGLTLLSTLSRLEDSLIWLDEDDNSYIRFSTEGDTVTIDPTYGLNEAGSTSSGSCAAACTMVSRSNLTNSCCSCGGSKSFTRSAWNANTYLCQ